jgi:hypothetical protein
MMQGKILHIFTHRAFGSMAMAEYKDMFIKKENIGYYESSYEEPKICDYKSYEFSRCNFLNSVT